MRPIRSGRREPLFSLSSININNNNMDEGNNNSNAAAVNRAALESGDLEELIPSSPNNNNSKKNQSVIYNILSMIECIVSHIRFYYSIYPTEFVMGCIVFILLCFSPKLFHHEHTKLYHNNNSIDHDWTNIKSQYDLKIGRVDHWCLGGGSKNNEEENCSCENPLEPSPRATQHGWGSAHSANLKLIQDRNSLNLLGELYDDALLDNDDNQQQQQEDEEDFEKEAEALMQEDHSADQLDVLFIGDSITERRMGRRMGKPTAKFEDIANAFQSTWCKQSGSKYEGLALGISGDTAPNLLWRLMHGELPLDGSMADPKVYWITIGTNDLHFMECSEEIVLLGILRIVEEIQAQKPNAIIVINSILPITYDPSGILLQSNKKRYSNKKQQKFDYWPSIVSINRQLELFAIKHVNIKYFDANSIFVDGDRVNIKFMDDALHPSLEGYKAWDKAIEQRLDVIFSKMEETKPANNDNSPSLGGDDDVLDDELPTLDGNNDYDDFIDKFADDDLFDDDDIAA